MLIEIMPLISTVILCMGDCTHPSSYASLLFHITVQIIVSTSNMPSRRRRTMLMMMWRGLAPRSNSTARTVRLFPIRPHSDFSRLQSGAIHTKSSPRLSRTHGSEAPLAFAYVVTKTPPLYLHYP
jgi:hypothetical protein